MTIVTARSRSPTVSSTTPTRWAASPLRAFGGTDWLSARSMSSRRGAVYCVPVRPVRGSTVKAVVRPHSRPVPLAMLAVTPASMNARGLPRVSGGSGWTSDGATASLSARTALSGRGTARPERIDEASVERIDCASSGARFHDNGGTRISVRGSTCGRSARHRTAARASSRRAMGESCASGTPSDGSR